MKTIARTHYKKIFSLALCYTIILCNGTILRPSGAKWTIMLYIQAKNNLAPYAGQNLKDMASAPSSKKVNILTQWDQPRQKGAWRYKISKGNISLENYAEIKDPKNTSQKLIDFVKWGAEHYPAQHYCIILWNHGTGVLNPPFGCPIKLFLGNRELILNPRINLAGILEPELENLSNKKRGILFDDDNKTFMTNADLQKALKTITSDKILGRKVDCVGFDACFMGMVEIAYQVRKYAKYMIASEELELARGWDYLSFTSSIVSSVPTPINFAKTIVQTYGNYYKNRTSFYTQSAIDLQHMDLLKQNLDDLVVKIGVCMKHNHSSVLRAVRRARNGCLQFSTRVYVDLHSFYSKLLDRLTLEERIPDGYEEIGTLVRRTEEYRGVSSLRQKRIKSPHVSELIESIKQGMFTLEKVVLERVSSEKFSNARGLSIYFPYQHVDPSYMQSTFAKESLWANFLDELSRM